MMSIAGSIKGHARTRYPVATGKPGRLKEWLNFVGGLLFAPATYHPERHYMRGPGPKWRERHPSSVWEHDPSNSA